MIGAVTLAEQNGQKFFFFSADWKKFVRKPASEGYYREAFSNADSFIDAGISNILGLLYPHDSAEDLMRMLELEREQTQFFGAVQARILFSKGLLNEDFMQRILNFKKARNLVLHSLYGEYALVVGNPKFEAKSQAELDSLVRQECEKRLDEAEKIWVSLNEKLEEVVSRPAGYYYSKEYYAKNPDLMKKIRKRKFPRDLKDASRVKK